MPSNNAPIPIPTWIELLIEREYAAALRTALEVKQLIEAREKFKGL